MSQIQFVISSDPPTNRVVKAIFENLPVEERRLIASVIAALTDDTLPTAVRPFMFVSKIIHELYFDTEKLMSL